MKNLMTRILNRRKFVINRKLQLTFMIISFDYVILFCVVMGMYLFIPLMMDLDASGASLEEALVAARRILYFHEKFWPALLLALFAMGCHSILVSHKIAGPLFRFNLIFKAIKEGTLPLPVSLRRGDYLYREMENINQMVESLRGKLTELQEAQAHLNRSILECKDTAGHSSMEELMKKLDDLGDQGRNVEGKLGYFKVIS